MSNQVATEDHPTVTALKAASRVKLNYGASFVNSVELTGEPPVLHFKMPPDTSVITIKDALGKDIPGLEKSANNDYAIPLATIEAAPKLERAVQPTPRGYPTR
jgi:hypothetical protein